MLIQNQKIALDFESKIPIKITSFSYKEGEIDKNGIEVDCLGVNVESGATITAHWLYSTQEHYVYVENAGSRIDSKTVKVVPPQNVLYRGEIGLEVHLESAASGLLKSQTASIPVVAALVNDEEASAEDENLNVILNLINATSNLHDAAVALDAEMQAAEVIYSQNEAARASTFKALETSIATNISSANTAITNANTATTAANTARDGANTAANNADSKATLANTAATNANTAATGANTAKTALDGSISTANTTKTAVDASATNANTKATLANDKATLADQKATLANTAATNANTAATNATNAIAEVVDARVDYFGTAHTDVDERIRADFETLASLIPTDIAFDGYESVTTNDTLSGDVKNTTLTGQTLVNVVQSGVYSNNSSVTKISNGEYLFNSQDNVGTIHIKGISNLKENTTYTLFVKLEVTGTPTYRVYFDSHMTCLQSLIYLENKTGVQVFKVTTKTIFATNDNSHVIARVKETNGTHTLKNIMFLEGDHTDKPLEFFEGLKSAEVSEVASHGVNFTDLTSYSVLNKYIVNSGALYDSNNHNVSEYTAVKSGKRYTRKGSTNYCLYDVNKNVVTSQNVSSSPYTFAPEVDGFVRFTKGKTATDEYLYEVTPNTPTTYVPYQSSKTTLSEPITLRSLPNGVADTYDFDTQTLTRRCGEVVLDGSESWVVVSQATETGFIKFRYTISDILKNTNSSKNDFLICDKFQHETLNYTMGSLGGNPFTSGSPTKEFIVKHNSATEFIISIAKSKLATPDVAGFKAWLAANPTTVVYELATPTTEKITHDGYLRSYDNQTTLSTESIVPLKLSATLPISYASALSSALSQVSALKAENQLLRSQMETQVAEVRDELNQVHVAMYRMMNFNQPEEGDHVIE